MLKVQAGKDPALNQLGRSQIADHYGQDSRKSRNRERGKTEIMSKRAKYYAISQKHGREGTDNEIWARSALYKGKFARSNNIDNEGLGGDRFEEPTSLKLGSAIMEDQ